MKTTGLHILGYITGLIGMIAGFSPALLGPHGAAIVGAAVALQTLGHSIYAGQKDNGPAIVAKALVPFLIVSMAVMAAGSLVACKTAPSVQQSATVTIATEAAVVAAVQNGSNDAAVWTARAAKYEKIAKELKAVNDSPTGATLATLRADLQPKIAALSPGEALAANAVIAALQPYIDAQVQQNPSVGSTQQAIDVILNAVIAATSAYTGT